MRFVRVSFSSSSSRRGMVVCGAARFCVLAPGASRRRGCRERFGGTAVPFRVDRLGCPPRARRPRATKMAGAQHDNALESYRRQPSRHGLGCPESGRRTPSELPVIRNPRKEPHIRLFVVWLCTCVAGPGLPVAANHDAFPALWLGGVPAQQKTSVPGLPEGQPAGLPKKARMHGS